MREALTHARLLEVLFYDKQTGVFTRKASGRVVGSDNGNGYLKISIDDTQHRAHRLAMYYVTGEWPTDQVDHIDGNRSNNVWVNLRQLNGQENTHNQRGPHKTGTTGFLGVRAHKGRFHAVIAVDRKRKHLGTFDTAESAHAAYVAAKRQNHSSCTI